MRSMQGSGCKFIGITKPSIGHLKACVLLPPLQLSNLNLDERSLRSNADVPPRPKTPDPTKRASSGALGCFGVGPRMADDGSPAVVRHNANGGASEAEREPSLPSGLIGMKNLGASLSSGNLLYMCRREESRAGQKCRSIWDQQQGHAAVQVLPSFFTCRMQVAYMQLLLWSDALHPRRLVQGTRASSTQACSACGTRRACR